MVRSVLAGLLSGTAISALFLAGVSLMLPPPGAAPQAVAVAPASDPAESLSEPITPPEPAAEEADVGTQDEAKAPKPAEPVAAGTEPVLAETPEPETPPVTAPKEDATETPASPEPEAAALAAVGPEAADKAATAEADDTDPAPEAETAPETAEVAVPAGSEFARPADDTPAALPAPEPEPAKTDAPDVSAPPVEDAPEIAELAPAEAPDAADAPEAPALPEASEPPAAPAADDTALPSPDEAPAIAEQVADAPVVDDAPPPPPVAEPEATAPADDQAEAQPAAEAAPAEEPAQEQAASEPAATGEAENAATDDGGAERSLPPVLRIDSPEPPQGVAVAPTPGFKRVVPGVKVNQLPTIGASDDEVMADDGANQDEIFDDGGEGLPEVTDDAGLTEVAPNPEEPAIRRFAAPFQNPEGKALLAIVLFDRGEAAGGLDVASIATLGLPVTVVVDPEAPDASTRAAAFRAAGFEVAMLSKLPQGASASDAEVSHQGALAILPEAVAIVGDAGASMGTDGQVAGHLVDLAAADGLGIVSFAGGLNPVPRLAEAAGVPHAEIWRAADSEGAGEEAIRRTLDRAAFEAAQTGRTAVALDSTPASVTALFAWASNLPPNVAVAPVSAVALAAAP